MEKEEVKFIDKLYKDLYKSKEVLHHSSGNEDEKFKNIEEYINKLEKIHNQASTNNKWIKLLKKMYHDKYVIKREDIPENYYKFQERMALERGYGHITITEEQKEELQNEVIKNQINSLDIWLDYLLSKEARFYPFWAKYWAFQGMIKLGNYDKEKRLFNKRTKETIAPFTDLNREALSRTIDIIIKTINKEKIEDKELNAIIRTRSFQKIYPFILNDVLHNNKNIIKRKQGKWIKYEQGSDPIPLVNSLRGYNTGWCTAGLETAKNQLACGDFYVFYTLDENDEYKIPRIAIRMEYDQIGEIRGIAKAQNIEPEMEEIVAEKIKDFKDKDQYYKKINDMKKLTEIYNKQDRDLTVDELKFLYELDYKIDGFGYGKDPRIEEIKKKRNKRADLAKIFNCDISQIALYKKDITRNTLYYYGDLNYSTRKSAKGLIIPPNIIGDLALDNIISPEGLVLPQYIKGGLFLGNLTSAEGITLPKYIGENIGLGDLKKVKGLIFPTNVGGYLDLGSATDINEITLPENIKEDLYLDSVTNANGIVLPKNIGGYVGMKKLANLDGLVIPDDLSYRINCRDFEINPKNIDQYRQKPKTR